MKPSLSLGWTLLASGRFWGAREGRSVLDSCRITFGRLDDTSSTEKDVLELRWSREIFLFSLNMADFAAYGWMTTGQTDGYQQDSTYVDDGEEERRRVDWLVL